MIDFVFGMIGGSLMTTVVWCVVIRYILNDLKNDLKKSNRP